jgi:spermidine synthase/Flp pilus assembly protein TadD
LAGAAALVFETLWVRLVTLHLGHTAPAVSAVLSAFMGGLAAGSWFAGRAADRRSAAECLRLYAACELGAGLLGLSMGPVLDAAGRAAVAAGLTGLSPAGQAATTFLIAAPLLALPAALMGASLPLLTRALRGLDAPEAALAPVYGLNTAGAMLGCLAAGLFLLPGLGLKRSLLLAAAFDVLAAALAWRAAADADTAPVPSAPPGTPGAAAPAAAAPLLFLALTGAAAMACEAAWARALALLAGSTVFAFTASVAVVLAGLAVGSLAFSRRRPEGSAGLGALLAALALCVALPLALYDRLPFVLTRFKLSPTDLAFLGAAFLAAPAALLMGAVLPWAVTLAGPAEARLGRAVGALYAANTAGAIVGAAAAGLVLLPAWGWRGTLAACAAGYAALGATLLARSGRSGAALAALAPGVLAVLVRSGNPRLEASGMFLYARYYREAPSAAEFVAELDRDRVIFHETGRDATVTVLESPHNERFLRVNGKTDASEGGDMSTQLLLGYMPRLWGPPAPKRALVVGLGAGLTAAAVAEDPGLEALDVVEIEPAVGRAAALFARSNRDVLADPRVRLVIADARQVLAAPGEPYDLIVSEPSNPWIAGVSALFTREAFALGRAKLAPGGVFCQWFHSYHMRPEDFRLVARTFAAVFPHAALLSNGEADYFLLGSESPLAPDFARFKAVYAGDSVFRRDLKRLGTAFDHPFLLLTGTFSLGDADLRRWAGEGPLHLDDRPTLESNAARSIGKASAGAILAGINAAKTAWSPPGTKNLDVRNRDLSLLFAKAAETMLDAERTAGAESPARKALEYDPRSGRAWTAYGRWLDATDREPEAFAALAKGAQLAPDAPSSRARLGIFLYAKGNAAQGRGELEAARRLEPGHPLACLGLGWMALEAGDKAAAREILSEALARPVPSSALRADLAKALARAQGE